MEALAQWEARFQAYLERSLREADAAHDLEHIRRVVAGARAIAQAEGAEMAVVIPAAWLHDCVSVPKHSPERSRASRRAADEAARLLAEIGYPEPLIPKIHHAIHAHSFSAGVEPGTLEARVVQDADRLDALGAVGIARTLMLGAAMGTPLYHPDEPIPRLRPADDRVSAVDHFFTKLLLLEERMQTPTGRREAARRTRLMHRFLDELEREVAGDLSPGEPASGPAEG